MKKEQRVEQEEGGWARNNALAKILYRLDEMARLGNIKLRGEKIERAGNIAARPQE